MPRGICKDTQGESGQRYDELNLDYTCFVGYEAYEHYDRYDDYDTITIDSPE